MTRNPATGSIVVGDVGDGAREELDVAAPGANLGWPCYEGTLEQRDDAPVCADLHAAVDAGTAEVTMPAVEYPHTERGGAVVAGTFYTGDAFPAGWRGAQVWADYAQGLLRRLDWDGDEPAGPATDVMDPAATGAPVDLATGPDGALWYLAIGGYDPGAGQLRRISFGEGCSAGQWTVTWRGGGATEERCSPVVGGSWGDEPPVEGIPASGWTATWSRLLPLDSGTWSFTADSPDPVVVTVDGEEVTGPVRLAAGTHRVEVELSHGSGETSLALDRSLAGTAPRVRLSAPWNGVGALSGGSVGWAATATDAEDGALGPEALSATLETLHFPSRGAFHAHPGLRQEGASGAFEVSDEHAPGQVVLRVVARAVDSSGRVGTSPPVYVCVTGDDVGPCVAHGAE